jgi:hypothetical protein
MRSQAIIPTPNAKRYLGQFCKHFAHKLPVELDESFTDGVVSFGSGTCSLHADSTALTMTVAGETAENIASLEDVAARHLVRFAFREDLTLAWQAQE